MDLQVHTFYEAVGLMVGAEGDMAKREEYLGRLMAPPNSTWQQIIAQVCMQYVGYSIHNLIHIALYTWQQIIAQVCAGNSQLVPVCAWMFLFFPCR